MSGAPDAARKANATRQEREAIARLRGGHFTKADKNEVREVVLDYLQRYMEPGEVMGDLLGPGWSARSAVARGMRVMAAEDCSFTARVLGDREMAKRVALRMGAEEGYGVSIGPFSKIVSSVTTAFYDPCGPSSPRWARDVTAMAQAGVRAFAATVLLSRVDGAKGLGEDAYVYVAERLLRGAAPGYHLERTLRYKGDANLPMAVFLCVSAKWLNEQAAIERARVLKPSPSDLMEPAGDCARCGYSIVYTVPPHDRNGAFYHEATGSKGCRANLDWDDPRRSQWPTSWQATCTRAPDVAWVYDARDHARNGSIRGVKCFECGDRLPSPGQFCSEECADAHLSRASRGMAPSGSAHRPGTTA